MHMAHKPTTFMCQMSWNLETSTSWNPQGLSRPVQGLLYLFMTIAQLLKLPSYGIWRFSAMFTSIFQVNTVHIHTFCFKPILVRIISNQCVNIWSVLLVLSNFLTRMLMHVSTTCTLRVLSIFVFTDLNVLIFGHVHKSWYPSKHSSS